MISYIKGVIKTKYDSTLLVVLPTGIGYEIYITNSDELLLDNEYEFYIHTSIREDGWNYWAFRDLQEKDIFVKLLTVQGIGPKTAFQILKDKGIEKLLKGINEANVDILKGSGVGIKTAQRIILDLKGKLNVIDVQKPLYSDSIKEAIQALTLLGYSVNDIDEVIANLDKNLIEGKDVQSIVKLVLKNI